MKAVRPIPQEFFPLTRAHFSILKAIHHRNRLSKGLPPSLQRRMIDLKESIRPAFYNDFFGAAVEAATSTWADAIVHTLQEHFESVISDAVELLSSRPMPQTLLDCSVNLALKWSRSQLKSKLLDNELDEAISLIYENQQIGQPTPSSIASTTAQASIPSASYTRGTQTEPLPEFEANSNETDKSSTQTDSASGIELVSPPLTEDSTQPTISSELSIPSASTSFRQTQLTSAGSFSSQTTMHQGPDMTLTSCERAVILGDATLDGLQINDCSVFSNRRGRLSFFKQWLQTSETICSKVSDVIVCLSALDVNNKEMTNIVSFRALGHHAKRVFPNARLSFLPCLSKALPNQHQERMKNLYEALCDKKPVGWTPVPLPEELSKISVDDLRVYLQQDLAHYFL